MNLRISRKSAMKFPVGLSFTERIHWASEVIQKLNLKSLVGLRGYLKSVAPLPTEHGDVISLRSGFFASRFYRDKENGVPRCSVHRLKFSVDINPLKGCAVRWEKGWGFDVSIKTARKHQVGMNRITRLLRREAWKESAGAVLYEVETGARILMYGTRYHEDVPMVIIGQGSRFKNQGLLYTPLAMSILIGGDEWGKYNDLVFPKLEEVIRVYNGQKIQDSPTTQEVGHNQGAGGSGESEVSDVLESGEND